MVSLTNLFGCYRGIIAYLVLRKEDSDKARECVIWGIVINTVALVAYTVVSTSI